MRLKLNSGKFKNLCLLCLVVLIASAARVDAQVAPEVICEGLKNPFGIAIQPETDKVFVVESGLQRVVAIEDGKATPAVEGFFKTEFEGYVAGPLSILFMDRDHIWVGHRETKDKSAVALYSLQPNNTEVLKADKHDKKAAPVSYTHLTLPTKA